MQKIIVSDTSCLGYLIQINSLSLLQIIYGEIIIPVAVFDEIIQLEKKGYDLSEFKNATWIKTYSADNLSNMNDFKSILDKGELQAISIAIDLKADLIIIDEKLGRIVASSMGFDITAKDKNLISSVKDALDKVILLGCRISKKLYNTTLKSCNEI